MKHLPPILCILVVLCTAANYAIDYVGGLQGNFLAVGAFPANIVPTFITFISIAALGILWVRTVAKGQPAGKILLFGLLSFLILGLNFATPGAKVFQLGFRHRMKTTISPDELRGIALASVKTLPFDEPFPGPEKLSLWEEAKDRAPWDALVKSTAVGKLDPAFTIFNHSNTVEIDWGGALVGHWGVQIYLDGETNTTDDIAPGIQTFIGQ